MKSKHLHIVAFSLSFVLLSWLNWQCGNTKTNPADRTTYAGLSDSATYVGMEKCKGCHANVHASFIHTGMGQSFDVASPTKSAGDYAHHPLVYDKHKDLYYTPVWEGDSLRFHEFRLHGKDTVYSRTETVRYIVGSGQHTNSHMWSSNGYVYQAPMTFYTQKQEWDLPPGFENGQNSRFNRAIGHECMTCHNGYPEVLEGSENGYKLVRNGIDCERCHGPGSFHVQEKSAGMIIDTSKYIDYSIVNPAKLPIDLQFDVCQRCHVQGNSVLKEGKTYFDFKPGMHLSDVMDVYVPVYSGRDEQHIMASHAERLKLSKCYVKTMEKVEKSPAFKTLKPYRNALTCVTCHNPHISVRQTNTNVFTAACNSCHQAGKEPLCTETEAKRKLKDNNCITCHMPFNGATDIPHVSVHDHRIRIPDTHVDTTGIRKFVGIACVNNPKPDNLSRAHAFVNYVEKFGMSADLLDSALHCLPQENALAWSKNLPVFVQVYYLRNDFLHVTEMVHAVSKARQLVAAKQASVASWTAYRIAESFQQTGNASEALSWYQLAVERMPKSAEFLNKLGNAYVTSGNQAKALEVFSGLVKEHPEYAPGWSNLGYLQLAAGTNPSQALSVVMKSLALDPDYIPGMFNVAACQVAGGDQTACLATLKNILKLDPKNEQAKNAIQQLNHR